MTHQSRVLQGRLDHEVTRETRESVGSPDQRGPRGPEAKLATLERKEGQGRLEVQEAMEYQGCLGQMAGQGLRGRKGLLAGKVPLGPQDHLGSCLDLMLCPEERVARAQWWLAIPCRRGSPGCRGRRGSKVRKGRRGRQVRQEQKAPWDPGDQVGDMDLQVKKEIKSLHCISISTNLTNQDLVAQRGSGVPQALQENPQSLRLKEAAEGGSTRWKLLDIKYISYLYDQVGRKGEPGRPGPPGPGMPSENSLQVNRINTMMMLAANS